jgi:hypothetical protein
MELNRLLHAEAVYVGTYWMRNYDVRFEAFQTVFWPFGNQSDTTSVIDSHVCEGFETFTGIQLHVSSHCLYQHTHTHKNNGSDGGYIFRHRNHKLQECPLSSARRPEIDLHPYVKHRGVCVSQRKSGLCTECGYVG